MSRNLTRAGSWWLSSFLHGSNDHDYLLVSHVLASAVGITIRRASLADLTNLSVPFQTFSTAAISNGSLPSAFAFAFDDYFFGSADPAEPLGAITTWSTNEALGFNLTVELNGQPLMNGGMGTFEWGG